MSRLITRKITRIFFLEEETFVDVTFSRSFDKENENENENQIEINVNKIFLIHGLYFHCVPY